MSRLSPTARHRCGVFSQRRCSRAKPRRYAPPHVTSFSVIYREYNENLILDLSLSMTSQMGTKQRKNTFIRKISKVFSIHIIARLAKIVQHTIVAATQARSLTAISKQARSVNVLIEYSCLQCFNKNHMTSRSNN